MNSAAIRELKLNDKSAEFSDNMKIVRRSDGTGKFENIMVDATGNIFAGLSLKSQGQNRKTFFKY